MKFNRDALIEKAKAEIERRAIAAEQANKEAEQAKLEQRAQHFADTADAWGQFATTIRKRLRAGQVIVPDDLPRDLRDSWHSTTPRWWKPQPTARRHADVATLRALVTLLEAVTDEEVSSSALAGAGLPLRTLVGSLR